MTFDSLPLITLGLVAVAIFWSLPERYGQDGVAIFTAIALAIVAPATAIVMLSSIVAVQQAMVWSERYGFGTTVTTIGVAALVTILLLSREIQSAFGTRWLFVGLAYSTLRHIHVLAEWRFKRIAVPGIGAYFRYHLLLPTLVAGPIHRLPHFERQCERRRRSAGEFFAGAERALLGLALVLIFGEYLIGVKLQGWVGHQLTAGFAQAWLASAVDLVRTYVTFAGLTDIALGFCLMMGLSLEENFNRPWLARNLIEFWSRWHMTLSLWCRDYVYTPVAVWFRSPLVGVFCAMFVLGLWHETSVFYILWGFYQATGIALNHLLRRVPIPAPAANFPDALKATLQPLAVLAWVSSARPVIMAIIGGAGS